MKDTFFSSKKTLNLGGSVVDLTTPIVMGIVNVTPDSFYRNSRGYEEKDMLAIVEKHLNDGATIIDVGGYSSRPGAKDVSLEEEKKRVGQAIKKIKEHFSSVHICVDTFRSGVVKVATDEGAAMVNDISGGELDEHMFSVVADLNIPYVMMHMKGTPQDMQEHTEYEDLYTELLDYFQFKLHNLNQLGVSDVIVDPGFGFSKTIDQNYGILRNLEYFRVLGVPILIGLSRKSMIYKILESSPDEALNGTSVLHTIGLSNGASILRVHDVKEAMEVIKLYNLTYKN